MSPKRLLLVDGNSLLYRSFYAVRGLTNSKGEPTGAVYGFLGSVRKLLDQEKPDYLGVVFDVKGPTIGHEETQHLEEKKRYKAHRKPLPDDLVVQVPRLKQILAALRIATAEFLGYEADDVIASLASQAAVRNLQTVIATTDKDLLRSSGHAQARAGLQGGEPPRQGGKLAEALASLGDLVLPGITHWNHPSFFAYFPSNTSYASVLGDLAAAVLGAQGMSWQTSPSATEVEEVVMEWLRGMVGLPDAFAGVIHDTASTATLTALLCARERSSGHAQARAGLQGGEPPQQGGKLAEALASLGDLVLPGITHWNHPSLAVLLEKDLGQPVTVVNRMGGGGMLGHTVGATASSDGHTITIVTLELAMLHWTELTPLREIPTYKDFTPVALLNIDPAGVQVAATSEWRTLKDLLDYEIESG